VLTLAAISTLFAFSFVVALEVCHVSSRFLDSQDDKDIENEEPADGQTVSIMMMRHHVLDFEPSLFDTIPMSILVFSSFDSSSRSTALYTSVQALFCRIVKAAKRPRVDESPTAQEQVTWREKRQLQLSPEYDMF
jgi:hypothetical protein